MGSNKAWRDFIFADAPWKWRFGKDGIVLRSPDDKGHYIEYRDLFPGLDIERAVWKDSFSVTPKDVERAILMIKCSHPEHRRGINPRLPKGFEVCMNCGESVRKKISK